MTDGGGGEKKKKKEWKIEEELSDTRLTPYNWRQQTIQSRHVHKNKKSKVVCIDLAQGTKLSVSKLHSHHTIKMDVLNHHLSLQQMMYNESSLFTEAKHTLHWNIILLAIQSLKFQSLRSSNWFLLQ